MAGIRSGALHTALAYRPPAAAQYFFARQQGGTCEDTPDNTRPIWGYAPHFLKTGNGQHTGHLQQPLFAPLTAPTPSRQYYTGSTSDRQRTAQGQHSSTARQHSRSRRLALSPPRVARQLLRDDAPSGGRRSRGSRWLCVAWCYYAAPALPMLPDRLSRVILAAAIHLGATTAAAATLRAADCYPLLFWGVSPHPRGRKPAAAQVHSRALDLRPLAGRRYAAYYPT